MSYQEKEWERILAMEKSNFVMDLWLAAEIKHRDSNHIVSSPNLFFSKIRSQIF